MPFSSASGSNPVIQSLVTEYMRSRVMSYYTMAFFGSVSLGSLLTGALADRIGAPHTVMVSGTLCIGGSLWLTLVMPNVKADIGPTCQRMGLPFLLRQKGVTQIVLSGVATSIGVESTARSAFDHGYNVTLVTDAMTDLALDAHVNSIEKIFPRLGETGTKNEILKMLV